MMPPHSVPTSIKDPINQRLLAVAEDQLKGFCPDPWRALAQRTGLEAEVIRERVRAMTQAGVIRRVRQTLTSGNLAAGALVAWKLPEAALNQAFDWLQAHDPFTGHVVIRSAEPGAQGGDYRLWTTLKVPTGLSPLKHCQWLQRQLGASDVKLLPTIRMFALGVGHVRRQGLPIGARSDKPAEPIELKETVLTEAEWKVLGALKRDLTVEEMVEDLWAGRAREVGLSTEAFCQVCADLDQRGVIGRFSTFLEHTRLGQAGGTTNRQNGLFQWTVPAGRELEAGGEIGRFAALTHVYWRKAEPVFGGANLFAVAHGDERAVVLAHKAAIDAHLRERNIPCLYTSVFWGTRALVRPSELLPEEYARWCAAQGIDVLAMRAGAED